MLHVLPYGETTTTSATGRRRRALEAKGSLLTVGGRKIPDFDAGFFVGLMVGEGHFGGDARQPQITLRMHTDHAAVFAWLMERFPGGRLYGPYAHSGRRYFQWMARGAYLRDEIVPLLDRYFTAGHSGRAHARYERMKATYRIVGPDSPIGERG